MYSAVINIAATLTALINVKTSNRPAISPSQLWEVAFSSVA